MQRNKVNTLTGSSSRNIHITPVSKVNYNEQKIKNLLNSTQGVYHITEDNNAVITAEPTIVYGADGATGPPGPAGATGATGPAGADRCLCRC